MNRQWTNEKNIQNLVTLKKRYVAQTTVDKLRKKKKLTLTLVSLVTNSPNEVTTKAADCGHIKMLQGQLVTLHSLQVTS